MGCKESGSKSPKLTGDVSRFCHARVTLLSRFCHTFVTKKRYQEKSKSIYSVTKSYAHAHVRGSLSHLSKGRWVGWVTKGCGQTRRFGFRSAGTKLATDCRPGGLGKIEALSFHGLPLTQTEGLRQGGRKQTATTGEQTTQTICTGRGPSIRGGLCAGQGSAAKQRRRSEAD